MDTLKVLLSKERLFGRETFTPNVQTEIKCRSRTMHCDQALGFMHSMSYPR